MSRDRGGETPGFGELLRQHRLAAGLTQEELAERAGLSERGISDLERGARSHPHQETVRLLADALGLSGAARATFARAAPRAIGYPAARFDQTAVRLPVSLTPLIGRTNERAVLTSLLQDDVVRLVTLTGPGGVGKTRLAVAVAEAVGEVFPDGRVFVDLTPLRDPALVGPTIARTLGLRERGGQSMQQALSTFLARKRLLLVLDNYEHLLEAAPVVSDLLQAGPGIAVLVTSREPLHLRGEREYAVTPLALPDPQRHPSRTDLAQNPAVALFAQRAQAARAAFVLTAENASDVAAICARLDGLPLAIELAAAAIKVLPPAALLGRLMTRLPVLAGGPRDAPARQRTLRDTVAWSHDLLTEEERILFRHLGVFVGGWTLEAAEAVTNGDGLLDVWAGMTSLVDKSLVRQVDQVEGEPRFAMLETIREFALEQLREQPAEEAAIRRAHTRFFADLALAAWAETNVGVPETFRRISAEEDNLRAMLAQQLEAGDVETVLCVAGGSLTNYWTVVGGQFAEARAWLERAFGSGTAISPTARVWGLNGLTEIALFQGDFVTARTAATECRALAHAMGDPVLAVRGPFALSLVEEAEGHSDVAAPLAMEAVAAARTAGDPGTLGWSLVVLAEARRDLGDLLAATTALEEALALFRRLGGARGEFNTLTSLAFVAREQGDLERAVRLHAESLVVRRKSGWLSNASDELIGIAEIARAKGHLEPAVRLLGAEETYRTVYGSAGWAVTVRFREQTRQALVEQLSEGRFAQAWEAGRALSTEQVVAEALALANDLAAGADT